MGAAFEKQFTALRGLTARPANPNLNDQAVEVKLLGTGGINPVPAAQNLIALDGLKARNTLAECEAVRVACGD